jgi:peptidoglycan/xylan/chitin deacetylase (PgdA/CDA1 family)
MILLEILIPALFLTVLVYLTLEYSLFIPSKKGLPVLMYHNISEKISDGLNIPADKFELQLMYLKEKGYQTISLKELAVLIRDGGKLPKKTVILTFDDAFISVEKTLLKLLERYQFSAVVFIPVAFIGKSNIWDNGSLQILSAESLQKLSRNAHIEIGLHSFLHRSYNDLAPEDMQEDLKNCRETLSFYKIPYMPALAYPYGGYPKKD